MKQLFIAGLLLLFVGCNDILERDIEDAVIELKSPPMGAQLTNNYVTFWWSEVEGASNYQLQIVSPTFDYAETLYADTIMQGTSYTYVFNPGEYSWRVKAMNEGYETDFYTSTFTIDSIQGPGSVVLKYPQPDALINDSSITFEWYESMNATQYRIVIEVEEGAIATFTTANLSVTFPDTENNLPMLEDGSYFWKVRAENPDDESDYTIRSLTIDLTPPDKPLILSPEENDTVSDFTMTWSHSQTDVAKDSLKIYSDTLASDLFFEAEIIEPEYTYSGAQSGWYLFEVKSIDAAGNESEWSDNRKFYYDNSTK